MIYDKSFAEYSNDFYLARGQPGERSLEYKRITEEVLGRPLMVRAFYDDSISKYARNEISVFQEFDYVNKFEGSDLLLEIKSLDDDPDQEIMNTYTFQFLKAIRTAIIGTLHRLMLEDNYKTFNPSVDEVSNTIVDLIRLVQDAHVNTILQLVTIDSHNNIMKGIHKAYNKLQESGYQNYKLLAEYLV